MFVSVPRINVCVLPCALTALFVSVKLSGAGIHTHTHRHRSQWWLIRLIRTSNEKWWEEFFYLTEADDQCPWSPSEGWRWRVIARSASSQSHKQHINSTSLHRAFKRGVCFIFSSINNTKEVINCPVQNKCSTSIGFCSKTLIILDFYNQDFINNMFVIISENLWSGQIIWPLLKGAQRAREPTI